jgi:nicotinamidase-related amidase
MSTAPRRALVVIDVQNEYFGGGLPIEYPPIDQTLPNVTKAMDAAAAAGVPVVVVQHSLPAGAPVFDKGTHGWQLHPEVARRPRDLHVEKTMASVYSAPGFAEWLAREQIDTLAIAGYMTHNCDASTIYEAAHRGLKVEWLSDASGALPYENAAGRASAEEIHRVFGVVFHSNFAAVATTQAWIDALKDRTALPLDNVVMSNRRGRGL